MLNKNRTNNFCKLKGIILSVIHLIILLLLLCCVIHIYHKGLKGMGTQKDVAVLQCIATGVIYYVLFRCRH